MRDLLYAVYSPSSVNEVFLNITCLFHKVSSKHYFSMKTINCSICNTVKLFAPRICNAYTCVLPCISVTTSLFISLPNYW
jgi:hypothetical protein